MAKQDKKKKLKVSTPKGRPMLYWVGKQPPEFVQGYPCQLMEAYDPQNKNEILKTPQYQDLKDNWHNLLFHGDNKDVLATLLEHGFRGKVDLIYIDPPFASNKDYLRKVELRGLKDLGRIEKDDASILQQTMYEDIWKRDEYFQFMYDRLILLKELLAETGSIYVHLDYRMIHYIQLLMDEIFGEDNFINEVIWSYKTGGVTKNAFARKHDSLLFYAKSDKYKFNTQYYKSYQKKKYNFREDYPELYDEEKEMWYHKAVCRDVWEDIHAIGTEPGNVERTDFSTQKPEAFLERIIQASSDEDDLVLDSFVGSGTSCVVAQKLGRRWIGVDVNKGAIQLTSKRVQKVIQEQIEEDKPAFKHFRFATYKVNNYDLKILKTEAKELAIQQYGITKTKTDTFFDGIRDENELVKFGYQVSSGFSSRPS